MSKRLRVTTLSLLLITGCGGGSGPAAPSTVNIGGTVTGLIGKLVLQNNGGDSLLVTANGKFQFPTALRPGIAYAVSVSKQPSGPSCAVSSGSGIATADVTDITVSCTTDPATFYIPINATPVAGTSGGTTGLLVVTTKAPAEAPIPILNDWVEPVALVSQNNGSPSTLLYATHGSSRHIWSLDLSGNSTLTPSQVSTLTLPDFSNANPSAPDLCRSQAFRKNLNDARAAVILVQLPVSASGCQPSSDPWVLVHSTDSPSTTPVTLRNFSGVFLPLYQSSGALAGIVALDTGTHRLNFYADETFTNPAELLDNVGDFHFAQQPSAAPRSPASDSNSADPTYAYVVVRPVGTDYFRPGSVYRIDSTGTLSGDLYDTQGPSPDLRVVDSDHVYFMDPVATGDQAAVGQIVQGMAKTLYTFTYPEGTGPTFAGVAVDHLIFTQFSPVGLTVADDVLSLPVGYVGAPTKIASSGESVQVQLAGSNVLVNLGLTGLHPPDVLSTQILDASGTVLRPDLPGSRFVTSTFFARAAGSPILQLSNLPDSHFASGGEIDLLDHNQPTSSAAALKNASGANYTVPAGVEDLFLQPITAIVGTGVNLGGTTLTVEYDLMSGIITPISLPNTRVNFLL